MGYVSLSIYVGKTSKKVSGQRISMVRSRSWKLKKRKILRPQNLDFFTARFTKMNSLVPKFFSFHLQKKNWGQLIQK